ncbi:MAG: hypothetical protein IJS94_07610 [Clostridia bacterium]|nr:hypothetical protein [Clostridia bacterium]
MIKQNDLNRDYFEWLCDLVCQGRYSKNRVRYSELLKALSEKEFFYFVPMDENRKEDGINLRYRFENETGLTACPELLSCTVFEMMAALSLRCEEDMLDRSNAASLIFWDMIESLGLLDMEDGYFDQIAFNRIISILLRRDYEPSGKGGLFTIRKKGKDMRLAEIWYQLCWYLNERSY